LFSLESSEIGGVLVVEVRRFFFLGIMHFLDDEVDDLSILGSAQCQWPKSLPFF
jgi:hypothetical protein